MMSERDLYDAILARRSVRRYDRTPLDEPTLARVREIISGVRPLNPENQFEVLLRDHLAGEDLVEDLGGYGRLVTPPHYLAPYLRGDFHPLEDLGYRVEQIAVRLTALGIGSCYIGALRREDEVRARFGLPSDARVGAFLTFGRPATTLGGRAVNRLLRLGAGATRKLPAERIFFLGSFDEPAPPFSEIAPLIEAARHSPSAVNAQPWRFLWRGGQLHLFVTKDNRRYGRGPQQKYSLYDGGICMANVALALEALDRAGRWVMLSGTELDLPEHPANLHPMAALAVDGSH
jgi:nitroreductase